MRFLHTADWQIGMKAAHVGEAAVRVRDERLAAARRVVETARIAGAEFILLAGDTFEDNGVDRVLVQRVADILAEFGGPVYVIPGNHDPLIPGSVWDHPAWISAAHVQVLREAHTLEVPGGMLYPCPVRSKHSGKDPTGWIDARGAADIRIGVAHGTVEGLHLEEPEYPIARDAVARAGLDYLALGHWHSTSTYTGPDGAVRIAYSGTHETTKFGERDSGNVLIVEIAGPGATPAVSSVRTGALSWVVMEEETRASGDLALLRERIEAIENPGSTLVDLRISGLLAVQDQDEIDRLSEILASRFLFGRMDTSRVQPAPQDQSWVAGLSAGILRNTAARLRDLADPAYSPRPEGASPEIAARALLELFALVGERTR